MSGNLHTRRHAQSFGSVFKNAFTLLETIVVIGVIAILIGITLPALFRSKKAAAQMAAAAHQMTSGRALLTYLAEHDGLFPSFVSPERDFGYFSDTIGRLQILYRSNPFTKNELPEDERQWAPDGPLGVARYWEQTEKWAYYIMTLGYMEADVAHIEPSVDNPLETSYYQLVHAYDELTHSAYAPPDFWVRQPDALEERLSWQRNEDRAVQRIEVVAFPSQKVLLRRFDFAEVDDDGLPPNPDVYVFLADGHSERLKQRSLGSVVPLRNIAPMGIPGLTTLNGLRGRDLP